jgi:predicted chitinase
VDPLGDTTRDETRKINGGEKSLSERAALRAKLRVIWA